MHDKRIGITAKNVNERCSYYFLSLYEIACLSALPFVKGFDYKGYCLISRKSLNIIYDYDDLFRSGMIFFHISAVWVYMWILWEKKPQRVFAELLKVDEKGNNQSWLLLSVFWCFVNKNRCLYFPLFLTLCCFHSFTRSNIGHMRPEGYRKSTIEGRHYTI